MDFEGNLEYKNLEDDNVSEYENYSENESLSDTEKDESLESLFELDFNMLASAKTSA